MTKLPSLVLLGIAEVLALSLWFSATATVPTLLASGAVTPGQASLFTSAVQGGFVAGTVISAISGLSDRIDARRLFAACTLLGAAANLAILAFDPASPMVPVLRFVTGASMAGVYPVGMRIAASWAKGDLGFLVGLLVGAVTLGSASPHLVNAIGGLDWRLVIATSSAAALVGAVAISFAGLGPAAPRAAHFRAMSALKAWRDPALRLANLGYLGHMWELYAMWAWLVVFLGASFAEVLPAAEADSWARLVTFLTIAVGGLGSIAGGILADRLGRTVVTSAALAISGACCLVVGLLFGASPVLLTALCLIWGVTVVADSAQFSASIAELSEPSLVGTMLTVQTSAGFLLTMASIHLIGWTAEAWGWPFAFMVLAAGPVVGIWAMLSLRRRPESARMAHGRR